MKTFVIIPAYNEERHIAQVINETLRYAEDVIVVDDGSKDRTFEEARKTKAAVLHHSLNLGKGAALRTGAKYGLMNGAEAIIFIDSDGQHMPRDIPRLIDELKESDIVFTYRNLKSMAMPLTKKFGNFVLNTLMNALFNIRITDTQCGYKIMTAKAYERLNLISSDYNIESEIAAKAGKYRLRFRQLPIETLYSDKYKGTTVLDGIGIALRMVWWRVSR